MVIGLAIWGMDNSEILKSILLKLQERANEAINTASQLQPLPIGAIDWGNLRCSQTSAVVTESGKWSCAVTLESAAPECAELHKAVKDWLAANGWPGVTVVTEW